jgi:anaerobic selenocysteine-containing dehydrogenase
MKTVLRTCPLCDSVCGLKLTLDDAGHVTSVKGDPDDPLSKGFICPKGASLGHLDEDPDRLTAPLVRKDGEWLEVGWDEAFQTVHEGLNRVIDAHGRQALAVYFGNPTFHTMGGILYRMPLSMSLGTPNVYSASTIDQMPKHVACGYLFGDAFAISVPDINRTDYLLVLGANPVESNGSLCTAPNFPGRLKALRERGGKLVVVDPRRTPTAELADEHVFVRPGTDACLLFGIVHTLLAENLLSIDLDVNGLDDLRRLAEPFTPAAVAGVCGVDADTIARIAREIAAAPTAAVYSRVGVTTTEFGTITQWLVDVINILTGNFDRPGGVMFTKTATMDLGRTGVPYRTGAFHSRVRGLPESLGELPVATLADEIETPGAGQVRALIAVAGNPVLSAPGGPRIGKAMETLDFMVCVDPYLNETTRHANVILPPPRILQMAHYDFLLLSVAVHNYTRFSPPILPLRPGQLSEPEIMARLTMIAAGMGPDADPEVLNEQILGQFVDGAVTTPGSPYEGMAAAELRSKLEGGDGPERMLDIMLRLGSYGLTFNDLLDNPHGIDLGPLRPRLPELLCTASGKVELAPQQLSPEVERLRERLNRPHAEMLLIGRRQRRSLNSWLHNVTPLVGGSNTCTLHVNPDDIARLGLGEQAIVRSANGELVVPVEPSETIMPGVVSLPHGWGHAGTTQGVAAQHAGVNANTLTDESVIDVPSGNAVFNGVPVTVSPLAA